MRLRGAIALLGAGAAGTLLLSGPLQAQLPADTVPAYTFVDLGSLRGRESVASGINAAGQVSGHGWFEYAANGTSSNYRAFRVSPLPDADGDGVPEWHVPDGSGFNARMEQFTLPSGYYWSEARGINSAGAVAGQILGDGYSIPQNAFYGAPDLTGVRVTADHSWAWGVNDRGSVVGEYWPNKGGEYAAVWRLVNGSFTRTTIGVGQARGLNNLDQAAGHDGNGGGNPWIWLPSPAYGLPAGKTYLATTGSGRAINDLGHVVGGDGGPTLWTPPTDTSGFGTPGVRIHLQPGDLLSGTAQALNSPPAGQPLLITGSGQNAMRQTSAFVWDSNSRVTRDLNILLVNPPPGRLFEGRGVNAGGMIAGNYRYTDPADGKTYTRPFVLLPNATLPNAAAAVRSLAGAGAATTQSSVALSWTDNAGDENGVKVDRSTDGTTWLQVAMLPAGATTFTDTGLTQATRYTYRVSPFNVQGYGAPAEAVVTTPGVPLAPTGCTASALSSTSVRVRWRNNSNAQTAVIVQVATDAAFTQGLRETSLPGNATQHDQAGLTRRTTYYVRVRGVKDADLSDWSNTASVATPAK